MRSGWIALALVVAASLATAGCKVCVGACKKDQGRAVTAVVPAPDGSIKVTTCTLTTKGSTASVSACKDHQVPPPQ
jgi:hypothetical protein